MSNKKGSHSRNKDKAEAREYIADELCPQDFFQNPNPISSALKLNEFRY